jgi:O-antigen ligase
MPRSTLTDYWARTQDPLRHMAGGLVLAIGVVGLAVVGLLVVMMPVIVSDGLVLISVSVLLAFLVYRSCPGGPLWAKAVAVIFLLNVVLNYGFANVVVGPGTTVMPVNELVLAVVVPIVFIRFGARIVTDGPSLLMLVAAALPLVIHLPQDFPAFGLDAARDALRNVDMFAYFAGIGLALTAESAETWRLWRNRLLRWTLVAASVYFLSYPISTTLQRFSPYSFSYQQPIALLGQFQSVQVFLVPLILGAFLIPGLFDNRSNTRRWLRWLVPSVGFAELVMFQHRTTYFVLLGSVGLLFLMGRRRVATALLAAACATGVGLAGLAASGFDFEGRIGRISLSTVEDQIEGIGDESSEHVQGRGFTQRADWWRSALTLWAENPKTMIFGVGYGIPLTNFHAAGTLGDVVVREPHNSFITSLVRGGLAGFLPWFLFHVWLLCQLLTAAFQRETEPHLERGFAQWLLVLFGSALFTAMFEPVYELPFFAITLYILWGSTIAELRLMPKGRFANAGGAIVLGHTP